MSNPLLKGKEEGGIIYTNKPAGSLLTLLTSSYSPKKWGSLASYIDSQPPQSSAHQPLVPPLVGGTSNPLRALQSSKSTPPWRHPRPQPSSTKHKLCKEKIIYTRTPIIVRLSTKTLPKTLGPRTNSEPLYSLQRREKYLAAR